MKTVVLKVEVLDEKIKQKAMKAISGLKGLDSIEMNMKDRTLTVTGDIDPVTVASKLKKLYPIEILTVGPTPYYYYNYNQYHPPQVRGRIIREARTL